MPRWGKRSNKLYDLIYADPPWRYEFSSSDSRKIENKYPTMAPDEISILKIPAKKNSVCFLWATAPKLELALLILYSWKFQYKTHIVWDKERMGRGYWSRVQHELLLIGTRGKFPPPATEHRRRSIYCERRSNRHSEKPKCVREWINEAFPNTSKLEMFAREDFPGWDRWGNE